MLLHDFALSSHSWSMIHGELAANRRVIAVDLPGAGNSDRPAPASADGYSLGWLAKQCAALIHELGLTRIDVLAPREVEVPDVRDHEAGVFTGAPAVEPLAGSHVVLPGFAPGTALDVVLEAERVVTPPRFLAGSSVIVEKIEQLE